MARPSPTVGRREEKHAAIADVSGHLESLLRPGVGVAVVRAPAGNPTDGYVIGKADWDALKGSDPQLQDTRTDLAHWLTGKGEALPVGGDAELVADDEGGTAAGDSAQMNDGPGARRQLARFRSVS